MSCEIKVISSISDVDKTRRYLFPTDDARGSDSWLQNCEISLCPTGDVIALVRKTRIVILASKWDSNTSTTQYQIAFCGVPEESDAITSVLCLPIVGQTQNSDVGPDWICIALGFESGNVRFYTDNGQLLFQEQIHYERVCGIKCQSQHSPRPDINSMLQPEEVYVQYPNTICVIAGSNLFSTLRNCRSQLAIAQAKNMSFEPPEISVNAKKWGYQDQNVVNDSAVVGLDLTNTFDHLLRASTFTGFDARYRAMPPHNTLVMAAGAKPFLGFHYALEGGAQPVLSDVAKAVANKLKSALPGWLTGTKPQPDNKPSAALQPPEPMGCRFGLSDIRRTTNTIILSPDHKLAAVSDSLGRVLLVDTFRGVVLRIYKGYREAQCCFIQVPDERKSKRRASKVALFLVIYSPKKGTVEVFSLQQSNKIVCFSASKHSQFLYIDYGLMGFTSTTKSRFVCQFTSVLIDNDGTMKQIAIPFHFALTEKNSKRVRDIHLCKKLKHFLKTNCDDLDVVAQETLNICADLKTTEMKLQCLEMLIGCKEIPAEVIIAGANVFAQSSEELPLPSEMMALKVLAENVKALLEFYLFCTKGHADLDVEEKGNDTSDDEIEDVKAWRMARTENLQKLLELCASADNIKSSQLKVSFTSDCKSSPSDFLSAFDLSCAERVCLKQDLDNLLLSKISEIVFSNFAKHVEFGEKVTDSKIAALDCFKMLLFFWVNRPLKFDNTLENEMRKLAKVVYVLAQTASPEEIAVDYNKSSKFWTNIRELLANSPRPFLALTAAIVCHNVAQKVERERELQSSGLDDSTELWEKLTQENCKWTLLIGKLEDVSLLNIVLTNKIVSSDCVLLKLRHEMQDVSLKYILEKGRGTVSELVGKWLTGSGVCPERLIMCELLFLEAREDQEVQEVVDTLKEHSLFEKMNVEKIEELRKCSLFEKLNLLRTQFPYSLQARVLVANMAWEYSLEWQKDIACLEKLSAALKCSLQIPDVHIKRGVMLMMWNTRLRVHFENCCKLINKVGKLPKARLCEQDTRLSDLQIVQFLEMCVGFLDDFLDTIQKCCVDGKVELQYEPLWENGSQPLAELAFQQNAVSYNKLYLHHQLALLMHMMCSLGVKHSRPIQNLFGSRVKTAFFSDLTDELTVNWHFTDDKTSNSQVQFLFKIISASIEGMTINKGLINSGEHVKWMAKCKMLGRVWNMNIDVLTRYQVTRLFAGGFDALARELMPMVSDTEALGPVLLEIAGKRLKKFLAASENFSEEIAALSPAVTIYLDNMDGEWCEPSSLTAITELATCCLQCIRGDQEEYKLANSLLDACLALQVLRS